MPAYLLIRPSMPSIEELLRRPDDETRSGSLVSAHMVIQNNLTATCLIQLHQCIQITTYNMYVQGMTHVRAMPMSVPETKTAN